MHAGLPVTIQYASRLSAVVTLWVTNKISGLESSKEIFEFIEAVFVLMRMLLILSDKPCVYVFVSVYVSRGGRVSVFKTWKMNCKNQKITKTN